MFWASKSCRAQPGVAPLQCFSNVIKGRREIDSMADQHENNSDEQWVVAYYDLLGIQREMAKWENPQVTCDKIDLFRTKISKELLPAINRSLEKRNEDYPGLAGTLECGFVAFGFADSMVVASKVINCRGHPQPMALSMLLTGMIPLAAELLAEGVIFRAGIDVGVAQAIRSVGEYFSTTTPPSQDRGRRRVSEGDIAGPAYIAACQLASMPNSPPGAYLGLRAVKLLQEAADGIGRFQGAWVNNARQSLDLLMRLNSKAGYAPDVNGDIRAVDFANIFGRAGIDANNPHHKKTHDFFRHGYQWVRGALQTESDQGVRKKLQWLKTYLESRGFGGPGP